MSIHFAVILVGMLAAGLAGPADARTFVIPHVLEHSGRVADTSNTFDTTFFATYTGGRADGASVELYLLDQYSGQPLRSASQQEVCSPCTFAMGVGNGTLSIPMEDLLLDAGGFPQPAVLGYGIIVVAGADPDNVAIQSFVANARESALDLATFVYQPQPLEAATLGAQRRLDGIQEDFAAAATGGYDTTIVISHAPGKLGMPVPPGTVVEIRLYNDDGTPMQFDGEDIPPLGVPPLQAINPLTLDLGTLLPFLGGGPGDSLRGYATFDIKGDIGNVDVTAFVRKGTGAGPNLDAGYYVQAVTVPEPAASALMAAGVITMLLVWHRRSRLWR